MPSSVTHAYFSEDVYKELKLGVQNAIKDSFDYYIYFSQGTDPFMFYRMVLFAGKSRNIQREMHEYKTQDFFIAVIKYIHEHKLTNDGIALSFLFGYMCHYYLDIYCHPFIEYQNIKNKDKKKSSRATLEYAIDEELIKKREKVKPASFKVYKKFFKVKRFPDELKRLINETTNNVYNFEVELKDNDLATHYEVCTNHMRAFWRFANMDRIGIKLVCYKALDKLLHNKFISSSVHTVSEVSFYNEYSEEFINDNLNVNNNTWVHPNDKSIICNYSFWDLYNMALISTGDSINKVFDLLNEDVLNMEALKEIFTNLSYSTGIACKNKNIKFKKKV